MVTKENKKVLGGSWLLLTLLMIGMSWAQAVPPADDAVSTTSVDEAEANNAVDTFALNVEEYAAVDFTEFGYADENELVGSRTATSKTYVTDEGKVAIVTTDPIHYLDDEGVWQEVDLNIESETSGWSVTENTFDTYFEADVNNGVVIQVDDNIDAIRMGINPVVVQMERDVSMPMLYELDETEEPVQSAGNVLRYPMGQGVALDYTVTSTQIKQNLVLRDQPFFGQEFNGWLGLQEEMLLPHGYAVFDGTSPLQEGQVMKTDEHFEIRNVETGELLVTVPAPLVYDSEPGSLPGVGQYFIMQVGEHVQITTTIDSEWLMDENRTYPVMIDPTIDVTASTTYYTYKYVSAYGWGGSGGVIRGYSTSFITYTCNGRGSAATTCTSSSSYSSYQRTAVHRFNLANTMPSGATVTGVDYENHVGRYRTGSRNFEVAVMKSGSSQSSTMIDPASYTYSYGRYIHQYAVNSAASSSSTTLSDPGYYYGFNAGSIRSITMNSNGEADVQDAIDGNGAGSSGHMLGLAIRNVGNAPMWYWCTQNTYTYYGCQSSAAYKPHLEISYTGGSDTTAPIASHAAFDGKTTYLAGARTMYMSAVDASGVNTTAAGKPHLYYRVDGGSWNGVGASTIGTCTAGVTCNFKATIPAQTAPATGTTEVEYYWAYRDSPAPPNGGVSGTTGTTPAGGTGIPSNMQTHPSSPYSYEIEAVDNAADGDNKWQVKASGWNSYSYYSAQRYYDWQLTYYEPSREYHMEYDTSSCGTGSLSCFNTASVLDLRYRPGTTRVCTSTSCQSSMEKVTMPGLSMNARNGPGSDVIWYHDGTSWGIMGYEVSSGNGIEQPQSAGTIYTSLDYGSTDDGYVKVGIPGDITGYFGAFSWNATYNLNNANRNLFCINTNNNPIMFVRSTYTGSTYTNPCYGTYYYYRYNYAWNGWSNPGYDGKVDSSWQVNSKVSSIKPQPDTFPPEFDHPGFMDTYVDDDRTLSLTISDAGDPPMGLNTSSGTDSNGVLEGPHMKYRIYDAEAGSWSAWTTRSMSPDAARSSCEQNACTWSSTIPGTDRGNSVEYTLHAKDNNGNWNNTTAYSYSIGQPTKVFVIEWHDMTAGFNSGYNVNYQVRLYDVTNEIEFEYDTSSNAYYDYQYIGFQNPAANTGEMLRTRGAGFIGGQNPFANNYRIATDGGDYGYESYSAGMSELFNYNEEFTGSSNGYPYTYYCTRYFTSYRGDCSTVIDIPNDFEFEYFGSTFNGTQGHKIHAIRHGAMQFSTSSSSNSAQMMSSSWGTTMPGLPNSGSYVRNIDLAPWWGYYAAYYCYYNSGSECSIRSKMIPFDGAGMDVTADITTPTIWDIEQSPIRVNPSNGDYLSVSADLTIMPGVEVQIAEGKGMAFTGSCNELSVNGNETHPVKITNMGTNNAKGLAFTNGGCATGTDDRHTFTHADFENMDIAISAGSRHGTAPHYNGNVGNFTMSDVTFTNVSTAISHGSGQGTGFDLSGVDITNSADSCIVLPDDSTLTWVDGTATDCNTHAYAGQGAVDTGDGSTVVMENVDIVDAAVNGVIGEADSLWMSNVSIDASGGFGWQQTGTGVAQTGTASSGTDGYFFNVDINNYNAALTTHATDSLHMEQVNSVGDSNGYTVTPAGASSPAIGATGWTMDDVSADGGLTMARTQASTMDNIDLGGSLQLSGTAPSQDMVSGNSVVAEGITINGCGWKVDMRDVTIGSGGSNGAWISSNCASSASSNVVTVADGTMAGSSSNNNYAYARNSVLTVAEMTMTGMTAWGSNVASAGTNGDIRLIDVNFDGNDCLDSSNSADTSVCWVEAASSSAKIYFGGTGTVSVYRSGSSGNAFQANHNVAAAVHDSSGTELFEVGTSRTDASGEANVWLITDLYERDNNGATSSSATYTDHTLRAAGGAGQNVTTPSDPWYTSGHNAEYPSSDLPLEVGEHVYLKLEAFPMDFGGATKDCSFFSNNDSASLLDGYYTYTRQIITLSADMVLDGCSVHLQGTSFRMNVTSGSNPTITLRNGAELLISEHDGDFGAIRAQSSAYPWTMDLADGGQFTIDAGSIRDMSGGLTVGDGGTLEMRNGSTAYGSPNAASSTATVDVDGGTMIVNNAQVQNANSGVGIRLHNTAASSLSNVLVSDSAVGIEVTDAAPTIDGFTLTDNTVGMSVDGGMSLPTLYRSTILSGESAGWTTHAIDITSFAKQNNFVQIGTNIVYGGGNSDPVFGSYYAKYFMTTDRWRIAVDDGSGLTNVTDSSVTGYYPYSNSDPAVTAGTHTYDGGQGGKPIWDCNLYGYRYNPGGSYQYAYYYYFIAYGGGAYTSAGSYNMEPNEFGFRIQSAEGVTANTNYYPYMYWGSYWPSFYYSGNYAPPEGFNGMWGSYNVCQNYAYGPSTPQPAGYRLAYPIVDTSSSNIEQVVMYVDMVHYGADYYQDRLDVTVRAGSSVADLLSKDYSRDFGTADISNGQITGADTGIDIGGARASGDLSDITISDPVNEGVLISGSVGATMDQITVQDGRYGVRMGSAAQGKLALTNVDLDGQSNDGIVLSKGMNLDLSGTIQNAGYCGLKVLASNGADWSFDGLTLNSNTVGITHDGSGTLFMANTNMVGNTDDVTMSGSAQMEYLEGDITESKVTTAGSSQFTRLRALDVQITADSSGVDGAPVKILDADSMVVDSGTTDSNGDVTGMSFITWSKDSSGLTTANLAGYQLVTIATIDYTSGSVIDARYAMNTISLSDASGNSASADLTTSIDTRTCYSYSTTSYDFHEPCTGLNYRSSRTVDGVLEIGYYNSRSDMSNMVIQMDTPWNYADIGTGSQSFNGSTIFITGCYNSEARIYPIYPYQGHIYMDDTTVIAMCDESGNKGASSFRIGYSGTYSYGNFHITDSELLGLKTIATGSGYYQNNGDLEITDSLLVHYESSTNVRSSSIFYDDMCIQTSGFDDVEISGNTMVDCGVGLFVPNNFYATSTYYGGNGQNRLDVSDNTMVDCVNLCMWFYIGANSHDAQFNGNVIEGTPPRYGVYNQDTTLYDVEIDGNTIHADNPIYMRGAREWTITNNDITGISNAANACIYALNGHGDIAGNTCTDADGGIAISGIRSGNDVNIDGNTIGFTAGRLPTSAVGIYLDSCGLDEVFMSNNVVSTVMNAVNTDGCTVTDNNSVYTGLGGGAGRVHNVDMQQSTFSPAHLTGVCTGDSVRWTSRAYGSTNTPHSTTSDSGQAESWDSQPMNLGSSFVYQFTNVGNFTYYSSTVTSMTGSVNVADCSGNNLQTTGIDVLGGGDDITLNGVVVSGYGLGLAMEGGDLHMAGGTTILGDATAVDVEDVDVSTNGATVAANGTYGVGLDVVSNSGNHDLEMTGLSVNAAVGVLADGHESFRWNGGVAMGHTVLKTISGASGTIENMSGIYNHPVYGDVPVAWETAYSCYSTDATYIANNMGSCGGVATQINAGPFSTVTSIGNGVLNNGSMISPFMPSKLTVDADAIVHEGNLLDLTVLHMGQPATDVGLYIRSLSMATNYITGEQVPVPGGRAEYVSPSWRSSPGRTITIDGILWDWLGSNLLNDADDMMPGAVAVNATTQAHLRVTWDSNYMFAALVGPTFVSTDGLFYLDTAPGGSSTGYNWHSQHTLPIKADYMLWMEDLNNWGLRKVMPTGNWVDVTSSCPQITSYIFVGNPTTTTPVSEFRIPWSCLGSPTENVRWIAMVQWDSPFGQDGQVAGVFPEQPFNGSTTSGQTFGQFGNFNLVGGDLADGLLDDHLLLLRSYVGTGTAPGDPHAYQIMVKTRNAEGDYWDWDDSVAPLVMSTNQDITIDIMRAKPIIENLVDVSYDEDSGSHSITLTDKGSDYQDASGDLTWTVTDASTNSHSYPTPYDYTLTGQTLGIDTLENQFGGHRLQLTVTDSHGLSATQTMEVGIWNVNDAPVICNTNRFDCMPVFYDDGDGNLNVHDENFNGLITKELGDTSNATRSYIVDMANEQSQTDWNNEAVPQVYTWTEDEGTCVPFDSEIATNVLTISENTLNEAGGNCDIVLSLTDNANANAEATDVTVNFIVNPVNDQPQIKDFDTNANQFVETANGSMQLDWFWDVMEDDEDANNLTWDLSRLMADNDHPVEQLTWSVEETSLCAYENYFSITVDNDADTIAIDLIDDAATDAPTSEIDFLQDADNDGVADGGIHQMQPASGVYCTVYLWMHDTPEAPSHIDYAQSASGVYEQRSIRETVYIRVINTPEARPDYHFEEAYNSDGFNWQNINAVLPGTRVPVKMVMTNSGDDPSLYNYGHDVQVRFYADDNPTLIQDQVTLSWAAGEVPGVGESVEVTGYVTLNNPTEEVRAFLEVRTINPHTDDYIDNSIRRPALEELNWDNNNLTNEDLPQMVRLRPATSVASFAPGLVAVSLVGAFVGALLMNSRREEDEEEVMETLSGDDEAVSPVIATILLVAITVVLSGVIYVWAQSLASDAGGKATPRLTFDSEAEISDGSNMYWNINVVSHDNELAAQAVYVVVQWTDDAGAVQNHRTSLANPDGVYGFSPSTSDELVTYKDNINCNVDCSAGFGANDEIRIKMVDPASGEVIDNAQVTLQYAPDGGTAVILMTFAAQYNPPSMKATF